MGLDYLPSPLSRLRRQLSQRESQGQVSRYIVLDKLITPKPPVGLWGLVYDFYAPAVSSGCSNSSREESKYCKIAPRVSI